MASERPNIHKLSQDIIRLIAAGEVIERPASVVKELIENSLDAGACQIEVKIENGGMASITVRDDGFGIPADKVPLLLERHTTSKIENETDLDAIITLGFRGEALYSIAAVSDVIISTRFRDEEAGTRLTCRNSEKSIETISWPGGTQVESLKLFHSTPARRKFLRSEGAEFGRVAQLISSYALAYPGVAWRLIHNGRETFRTPGTGNLDDALVTIYGADTARKMLAVDYERGPVRISGSISSVEVHRARRTDQIIFLNGRLIKDPGITSALERPYMQFLPAGRRPLAVLKIECDPSQVDVNVHPHKREVRLAEPRVVTGTVYHAVTETLQRNHPLHGSPDQKLEDTLEDAVSIDDRTGEVFPSAPPATSAPQSKSTSAQADERDWAIREPKHSHTSDLPQSTDKIQAVAVKNGLPHEYPSFDEIVLEDDLPPTGHTVQFADTYLIYNQGRAVYLIDQHNLHERILFEEFMNREEKAGVASQSLLFPLQVKLPPSQSGLVVDHLDELNSLGFEIEEFSGGGSFVIRGIPLALKSDDPVQAFSDIIERASQDEEIRQDGGFRKAFVINLSCKSAIKAGQKLSEEEIEYLIKHIRDGTYYTCPHGRPTIIRLDEDWFRNSFKRSRKY